MIDAAPSYDFTRKFSVVLGVLVTGIFVIDLLTPLGVANGVMYVAAVLVSLQQKNMRVILGVAFGCSLLTLLGYWVSPEGGELWQVLWNRGLALGVIWCTALMGHSQWHQDDPIGLRERTLQDFMNTMPSACSTFDRKGTILSWNHAAERMYGYSQQEAIGASIWDLTGTPNTQKETQQLIEAVFNGRSLHNQLSHDRNKNGEVGWRLGNFFPVFNEQGAIAYGVNINVDVTAQKTAEDRLAAHHNLLQAIIESSSDPMYAKDRNGIYILVNEAAAHAIGTTPENVLGFKDHQLSPPHIATRLSEHDQFALTHTENLTVEEDIPVSGGIHTFSSTKSHLTDHHGHTIGLVGSSRDITDFKKTQRDLLLTELVFQTSPDHMAIIGRDYRYRRVNATYERVYGKSSAELVGLSVAVLLGDENFATHVQPRLDQCFQGEEIHFESWCDFPSEGARYMAVSYLPLRNSVLEIDEVVVISRDWTDQKKAEEALADNEQRLRTILDSMINFVGIGTVDGRLIDCNQTPLTMAGLRREDVIGKPFIETFWLNYAPKIQDQVRLILQRVAQGETVREDVRARIGVNTYITVDACYVPVKDATGRVIQIVHSGIDVTARRAAERSLKESQQKLQAIMDHSPNLIFMKDREGRYLHVNKQFEQVFNLPEASIIGRDDQELFPPVQAAQFQSHDRLVIQQNQALEFEEKALHLDGVHTSLVHKFPLQDPTGAIFAIGGIATDITTRKRSEEALRNSEERFRKYFESGLVGMAITSVNKAWVVVNEELCRMLGYTRQELQQTTWLSLTHPDDVGENEALYKDLLNNRHESYSLTKRYIHKNGSTVYTRLYANAVRDSAGHVEYLMTMIQDITKQKEAEAATRAAEQLALAAINALSAHICVLDEQGTILMVNESWETFALAIGSDSDSLSVGNNYFSVVPRTVGAGLSQNPQVLAHLLEVFEGRRQEFSYEYPCVSQTSLRWFNCRLSRFDGTDALRVVVAHQDITEQKQAESQLREAEMFTASILENLPNMVFVKDAQNLRFVRINKAGETLLGYAREDLLGKTDYDFFPTSEATVFITQDREVLNSREMLDIPEEPIHTKSHGIRMLHTKKIPLCDSLGTPQFLLGISEDITEHKAMEDEIRNYAAQLEAEVERRASRIQELEQRRMQVEKLAALSQIVAGVAHEINNPLASIAQSLTLLKRAIPSDHPKYTYTQKMQECIDRITHITRQLYSLYRPTNAQAGSVEVGQAVQTSLDIMRPIANKKNIALHASHSHSQTEVHAGITQGDLMQILCNLIQNAVDASCPTANIMIKTSLANHAITISIVDQGMGISPEVLPHIFDPFFTTKYGNQGIGLGLGLAISKNLLESMGGDIHCSTRVGHGTTFSIRLPRSTGDP